MLAAVAVVAAAVARGVEGPTWQNSCTAPSCSTLQLSVDPSDPTSLALAFLPAGDVAHSLHGALACGGRCLFSPSNGSSPSLGPYQQLTVASADSATIPNPVHDLMAGRSSDGQGAATRRPTPQASAESTPFCTVRYYTNADAFIFTRSYSTGRPEIEWPRLSVGNAADGAWGAISWTGDSMVHGASALSVQDWVATHGRFGGPLLLYPTPGNGTTNGTHTDVGVVLAPADHWDSQALGLHGSTPTSTCRRSRSPKTHPAQPRASAGETMSLGASANGERSSDNTTQGGSPEACWLSATALAPPIVPDGTTMGVVLLGRPGLARALRGYGAFVRTLHNTTRIRDLNVEALSYWSDNAAGYSWWSMPHNYLDSFGPIGDLYLRLHQEYTRAGVAMGSWESDNTFERRPAVDSTGKTKGGWCFSDWTRWNRSLYPTGGSVDGGWPAQMRAIQNSTIQRPMQFSYYLYYNCHNNSFTANASSEFHDAFVDVGIWKPLDCGRGDQSVALLKPERAEDYYTQVFTRARDEWGMTMLFKDDLTDQGQRLRAAYNSTFGVTTTWLGGLTAALGKLGLSMQACMTAPYEIMMTAEGMGAVSNARVSGDGGRIVGVAGLGATLTSTVGVAWSKDNVRTANDDPDAELQTVLAALSLGPVGIADALSAQPSDPAARITSNVTLLRAVASRNGTLLQPSYPLTPLIDFCTLDSTCADRSSRTVWATHTSIPCSSSVGGQGGHASQGGATSAVAVCHYFVAVGFTLPEAEPIASSLHEKKSRQSEDGGFESPGSCNYTANADKPSGNGHMFRQIQNASRAACCNACAADTQCDAYVRAPTTNTCYLIMGLHDPSHTTVPSESREIGFMPPRPPSPAPPPFGLSPEMHLFPLIDASATAVAPFQDVPRGFFLGSGATGLDSADYVATRRSAVSLHGQQCAEWVAGPVQIDVASRRPDMVFLAPVLPGAKVVLLGEDGMFAMASTYRLRSMVVTPNGGLAVNVAGNVDERVDLVVVGVGDGRALGACEVRTVLLGHNGLTTVNLDPSA